ncbi:MAG: PKD repeat protein, partial [Bacteroidia bacterium]
FDNDLRCNIFPTLGADQYTPGIVADTLNPDKICNTGCLKYDLPTPPLFSRSSYGTDWIIDSISVKTISGYSSSNFSLISPTSGSDALIQFCPDSTEVDSAFTLFLIFRDLNGKHCFSTFTSYILVGQEPDASFTIERYELCLGDSVKITSQNHTADDSVIYTLGDGQKEIEASFDYLYDTIGIYNITKYYKSFGCLDSTTKTVRVGTTKGANIVQGHPFKGTIKKGNLRDPDRLCTEDTTYYQIFPPKTIDRYSYDSLWRVKWVSLSTFDETPVHDTLTVQPDKFNNFRIRVFPRESYINDTLVLRARVVSLINSVCDTTLTRYITLRRSPHVGFTATPICLGETISFKDTTVNNSIIADWFWNFDDGSFSQLQQDTHTYLKIGTYKITLTALSITGCHGYYAREVEVFPPSEVDFITNDSCKNQTITFMDTSKVFGTGHLYLWDYGDGKFGIGRNSQHNFDSTGIFAITLYIDNGEGCIDSVSKRVNILQKPIANFKTLLKCSNAPVNFLSSSSDTVQSTYKWNFTALDSSSERDPSHQFDNSPNTIRLIVTNNGSCSDTISKTLQLDTVPVLTFSSTNVTKQQVLFTPSDSTNLTLKWYFGDGDSSSDIAPIHTYSTQIRRYEVQCIVQNNLGCVSVVTDSVTIGNDALIGPNKSKLKVFPNPFNKFLSIDIENIKSEILSIQIVDILGKQTSIRTDVNAGMIMVYPVTRFTPGLYMLKVQTQEITYSLMVLYSNDN